MLAEIYNDCAALIGKIEERIDSSMVAILLEIEIRLTLVRNHDFTTCKGNLEEIKAVYSCQNASTLCTLILQLQEIELRTEQGCDKKEDICECMDYTQFGLCSHICPCAYAEYVCDPYIEELIDAIEFQVCHLASNI